jgi:NAD(P)-dependent dehydrogenase (short-subunit alcohol dehydrogenase family)
VGARPLLRLEGCADSLRAHRSVEYGQYGIRVNSVSPGLIWRDGLDLDWPEGVSRYRRAVPLGRLGRPADIGNACVFLASSMAEWITGVNLVVDAESRCTRPGNPPWTYLISCG